MNGQRFRFFLDSDLFDSIETTEWVGFDGYKNTVEQGKGRLGRDVIFGDEDGTLKFYKGVFDKLDYTQALPIGSIETEFATMGFDWIMYALEQKGFEAKIYPRLQKNGVDFIVGEIQGSTLKTDEVSYVEVKVVQDGTRAQFKRQAETKINLNANEDINGGEIAPLTYENVLVLPLPTFGRSRWKYGLTDPKTFTLNSGERANFSNQQLEYGIRSTLSYLQGGGNAEAFPYIEAGDELRDVNINFSNVDISLDGISVGDLELKVIVYTPTESYVLQFPIVPDAEYLVDTITQGESFDSSYTVNIPLVFRGQRIGIYVKAVGGNAEVVFADMDIEITAISTSFPSVAPALRYIKLFDQTALAVNGSTVIAPRYREGGEFWGRMAISAWNMRGYTDKPFWVNWKDLTDDLVETNSDYQILPENEIFIGIEEDFYPDRELGNFPATADKEIQVGFNEKATVKMVKFEFENYAKDNLNAVHTVREFKSPNESADNVLNIKVRHIVDAFRIEEIRRENIVYDQNSSVGDDDNYCLLDTVALPEDTVFTQTAKLQQRINPDTGFLEILNNTFSGYDAQAPTFGWNTLGIQVGDTFVITSGDNSGSYIVESLTQEVIALSGGSPAFEGSQMITFSYAVTTATLMTRTMEGFDSAVGVPEEMANKAYTPTRLLVKYYGRLLKLIATNHAGGEYSKPYFKGADGVVIQETGFDAIAETDVIPVDDLPEQLLSQKTMRSSLVVAYEDFLSVANAYNTVYDDDTIGGYIVAKNALGEDVKLYLTKADYTWASGVLEFGDEVKYDG